MQAHHERKRHDRKNENNNEINMSKELRETKRIY